MGFSPWVFDQTVARILPFLEFFFGATMAPTMASSEWWFVFKYLLFHRDPWMISHSLEVVVRSFLQGIFTNIEKIPPNQPAQPAP